MNVAIGSKLVKASSLVKASVCCLALVVFASGTCGTASALDCDESIARFNKAIDAGSDLEAEKVADTISTDALCGKYQVSVQRRLAVLRLSLAQDLMARGRPAEEYERLLAQSARANVLWQAAATLAEVRFGERRFAEAAAGFDNAIEIVKSPTSTADVPSSFEIQGLVERASEARILSANGDGAHGKAKFVPAVADHRDGKLGGFYSGSVRGIVPHSVSLPITFDYRQATLTEIGSEAARELAQALIEQQPGKITVVGHTDPRGGPTYNAKLSEDRAKTVADFLRANGVTAAIEVTGVGSGEPLKITDPAGLTQEDIYALNRRVEWRRSNEAGQ